MSPTDAITIRDAAPSDAPGVAALLGTLGYPTDADAAARRITRLGATGADHVLVAVTGTAIVGVGALHILPSLNHDNPSGYLTALVVAESTQGTGVGTQLLSAFESLARSRGCDRLVVSSAHRRASAHAFYLHRGYTSTGLRFAKALLGS
jgi:GNAT superfamily N-acetyltransferase